ncbi:MAG: hypothetical protein Q8878_08505 [Bacillota bacterium]|nr:hypothetical protein [Bacillota bacterium]
MKKAVSLLLCFVILCMELATAAFAEDAKVSLETIEGIMQNNSAELKKLAADLKDAESDYSDNYRMVESLKKLNAEGPSAELTSQYLSYKKYRDDANIYYLTLKMQYQNAVQLKVLAAKQLYLGYNLDLKEEGAALKQLEYKKQEIAANGARLKAGYITKNEYDAASTDLKASEDLAETKKQETAKDLLSLKTALGMSDADKAEIAPASVDETAFSKIPEISFEKDSAEMLSKNAAVLAKQAALEIRQTATVKDYSKIDVFKVDIEQAKNSAAIDFRAQYDALSEAYRAYLTAASALGVREAAYKNGQTLYQYGYLSRLGLNGLELSFDRAETDLGGIKNTLYCAYLRYLQMKNGG